LRKLQLQNSDGEFGGGGLRQMLCQDEGVQLQHQHNGQNYEGHNFCFFADLFQTTIIKPENLFQQNTPSEVGVTTCTQDELHTSLILKIKMALYKYFGCKTA